jgi:hypothetical protein
LAHTALGYFRIRIFSALCSRMERFEHIMLLNPVFSVIVFVCVLFRYDNGANRLTGSPPGYRRRSPFVPFAVCNQTGSRIWFTTLITSPDR